MPSADKDILYRVAYEEAVRALSEQQAASDSFRTRAGLLLSASAITTSFLGAQTLDGGSTPWLAWLALLAFVGVAVLSLSILWPRPWEFAANPRDLIETLIESGAATPIGKVHRELSLYMHSSYVENRTGLEQLAAFFQIASGLLVTEVVIWVVAIASIP